MTQFLQIKYNYWYLRKEKIMELKRVKLNYRPIVKEKKSEIAFVVSKKHMNLLNQSIQNKVKRNQYEKIQSSISARDYHVGSDYKEIHNKSLGKRK